MTSLLGDPRAHVLRKKVLHGPLGRVGLPLSADPGSSLSPSPPTDLTWPQTPPPDLCARLPAQISGSLPPSRPSHSPFSGGTLLSLLRRITSGYHRDPPAHIPRIPVGIPCDRSGGWEEPGPPFRQFPHASPPLRALLKPRSPICSEARVPPLRVPPGVSPPLLTVSWF